HIAGGVDVRVVRPQVLVNLHAPISYSNICNLQPQIFDVGLTPNTHQDPVILQLPRFGVALYCQPAICRAHRSESTMQAYALTLELATQYLTCFWFVFRQ